MSAFEKKGVYQSELVRLTEHGGATITLKGKPQKSKDGDRYYVYFECGGSDHYLNIENDDIKTYLDGMPTGVPLNILGYGRGEAATIVLEDADGLVFAEKDEGPPDTSATTSQPSQAPSSSHETLFYECAVAARGAIDRMNATGRPLTDDERAVAVTLYIAASRR